jgi:multimeric flavodoxin WrbA
MGKNIVVLSGSPRRGATTDKLAGAFIKGAEAAGNTVTLFQTSSMKIGGCTGCGHCFREPGACVQKDDMQKIYDALKKADAIALASPIYYYSVTAQLKPAIDRFYALLKSGMPVKRAALLLTCGGAAASADSTISMFRQISNLLKWEEAGIIVAPRLHKSEEIDGREELEAAILLGKSI